MSRSKPYTTNQESWQNILNKNLRIPMNQREYSWNLQEIKKFLEDIFKIYDENKYVLKMGSIINLNYNSQNYIYDGQQRILTIILILNAIGCLSEKLKNRKIYPLLTIDTELNDLTSEQNKLKKEYNVDILPKMFCVNPNDMKGLVYIFNNKIDIWTKYINNLDELDSFEDDGYICKICNTSIQSNRNFIKHITDKHDYSSPKLTTKLYKAFLNIYNFFVIKKYDENKLIGLYNFIINEIDIQYYDCYDPEYVSKIFDWENNRGNAVNSLDIIKNQIIVKICDNKKVEIYERWEHLRNKENKIYKNFGQRIFDVSIQLYNNNFKRIINHDECFKSIIDNENTYIEIIKFFEITENLFTIMDKISEDKFGKLINNTRNNSLTWETYMWCLLPIFYKTNNINSELIKLTTKWYFRNLQFKSRSFNNLAYSNEFIKITNKVLINTKYDYYKDIKECLLKNNEVSDEHYLGLMKNMKFRSTNAVYLLLFLETCLNTNLQNVSLEYTLEHIICQKDKEKLSNQSLIDNIGNLTLIEGKNSDNGHKGNYSLGSKTYDKKKLSYERSSSIITRDIEKLYPNFNEDTISIRSNYIIKLLNENTKYY